MLNASHAPASPPPTGLPRAFDLQPLPRRAALEAGDHRLLPFGLGARADFERALREVPTTLSDYSFANNIIWLSLASGFWQNIEGCFCLFMLSGNGLAMMLPPLGAADLQRKALGRCIELMEEFNADSIARIDYVYPELVELLGPILPDGSRSLDGHRIRLTPANADYIYATADLVELKGQAYGNKRNEINKFRKSYPNHELRPFTPADRDDALALLYTWMQHRLRGAVDAPMGQVISYIEYELKAIERSIALYDDLGLVGLSLYVDGKMAGFTFGERITADVASVIIEKTDFEIQGAAQYLFREFCKVLSDCAWVNVGDDLGLENLRRVKLSYRPAMLGEKYTLTASHGV
jgi:hypothetical protein